MTARTCNSNSNNSNSNNSCLLTYPAYPIRSVGLFHLPHRRHSRPAIVNELASSTIFALKKEPPTFNSPPPGVPRYTISTKLPLSVSPGAISRISRGASAPSAPIKQPLLIAQPRLAESNGAVSAQHGVDFRSRESGGQEMLFI